MPRSGVAGAACGDGRWAPQQAAGTAAHAPDQCRGPTWSASCGCVHEQPDQPRREVSATNMPVISRPAGELFRRCLIGALGENSDASQCAGTRLHGQPAERGRTVLYDSKVPRVPSLHQRLAFRPRTRSRRDRASPQRVMRTLKSVDRGTASPWAAVGHGQLPAWHVASADLVPVAARPARGACPCHPGSRSGWSHRQSPGGLS